MTVEELREMLVTDGIVPIEKEEWETLAPSFPEESRHDTHLAGDLVILRSEVGPVAVEQPSPRKRVLRLLSENDVQDFVKDRLETYERIISYRKPDEE